MVHYWHEYRYIGYCHIMGIYYAIWNFMVWETEDSF
jgi:hypothetical protein